MTKGLIITNGRNFFFQLISFSHSLCKFLQLFVNSNSLKVSIEKIKKLMVLIIKI